MMNVEKVSLFGIICRLTSVYAAIMQHIVTINIPKILIICKFIILSKKREEKIKDCLLYYLLQL